MGRLFIALSAILALQAPAAYAQAPSPLQAQVRSICPVEIAALEAFAKTQPNAAGVAQGALDEIEKGTSGRDFGYMRNGSIYPTTATNPQGIIAQDLGRCFFRARLMELHETVEPVIDMAQVNGLASACEAQIQADSQQSGRQPQNIAILAVGFLRGRDRQALEELVAAPLAPEGSDEYAAANLLRCAASYHLGQTPQAK